ncbi:MAG: L,D-transpeptidase family protein [Candidatus Omnitrophica bacterium]|nr:L,D-transpeptidase family protein [Candidatus Omnitrophota bacterium]
MTCKAAIQLSSLLLISLSCASCAGLPRQHQPACAGTLKLDPGESRQIVEVLPSGKAIFQATLTAWSYEKGTWRRVCGPWSAVVGRNGFAPLAAKKEGDGMTPSGSYSIGLAFGKTPSLNTGLIYRQVTEEDVWVDDSASSQYNQWVRKPIQATSFEVMRRPDGLYDPGAVIEYNTHPVVAGRGSAIFIHVWRDSGRKPTAGCVALERTRLSHLLAWLNAYRHPVIVLGQADNVLIVK